MTEKLPKRGLPPMHPGELLREEVLPALSRSKTEIARLLGVSRQTSTIFLMRDSRRRQVWPCGSGSFAGMVPTFDSICGSGMTCIVQSRNSETRSRQSQRSRWCDTGGTAP